MKKFAAFGVVVLCLFFITESFAQKRIPVVITVDSTFGVNGRIEVNIGGLNNEATADFINLANKVTTVCGKVSTSAAGAYHLGMIRVDSTGKLDKSFGSGGIVNASWGNSDYPNSMQPYTDTSGSMILAGAGSTGASVVPALYRFKKNGTADSGFGMNGRLLMLFDDHSTGEALHVDISDTEYEVSGTCVAKDDAGKTGFAVMSINWGGGLDTNDAYLGYKNRNVIPALVHSVQGFFLDDRRFIFCGISDTGKHELILARFTEKRIPDSAFGINGLIHTGIILTGDTLMAQIEGGIKIVILAPTQESSPTHLTMYRFDEFGNPDSSYGDKGNGKNGSAGIDIQPSFEPKGLYLGNDLSEIVSGITNSGLGNSIFVRINDTTALPDPTFNHNGVISIDMDDGSYPNYLKFVQPIGKLDALGNIKRFIGVGGSIHNDAGQFMVVRFIGHLLSGVDENNPTGGNALGIYPNPASSSFKVAASADAVTSIRIVDGLGRQVMNLMPDHYSDDGAIFSGNAANIPNGIYYCITQSQAGQSVRKFMVAH